jgi:putative redox protein
VKLKDTMATLKLIWQGDLKFSSGPDGPPIELHSSTPSVVSPTQALAYAVMGCMAMDVVHVIQKARHDLQALSVTFEGTRAQEPPRRYSAIHLHFDITGDVPDTAVARAIELSRTTYCSVLASLRQDIEFKATFAVKEKQPGH